MLDYPTECVFNRRVITLHEMMVDETNGERRLPLRKIVSNVPDEYGIQAPQLHDTT